MSTKMILVIRKDLKMRRGKEIAQACHGAVGAILSQIEKHTHYYGVTQVELTDRVLVADKPTLEWIDGMFRKITVTVNSEKELLDLKQKCDDNGIRTTLIEDNGLTEFHGIKTKTVLAIGPDYDEKLDSITGNLSLY